MEYMKVWDWHYQVFFDKELENDLLHFSNCLELEEKELFLKTIDHFKSFFTFGMLLDYCTSNPTKQKETLEHCKKEIHKLMFCPKELYDYFLKNINDSDLVFKNELLFFLDYATNSGNTTLDHSLFLESIFGSYYEKLTDYYHTIKQQPLLEENTKLIKITNPEALVENYIRAISNNNYITKNFGKNNISSYEVQIKNEDGYGEWWDKEVSNLSISKLILYKNSFELSEFDFLYTLYHEIYPGHAHFYARTKENTKKCFDNGAMFMLEGYATFVEWNSLQNAYTHNLKVEACKLLSTTLNPNFKLAITTFIDTNTLPKELFLNKLIRVSQYPLFQESYYLGALILELMIKDNIFENANNFLTFLNKHNCGDFFSLWVKNKPK